MKPYRLKELSKEFLRLFTFEKMNDINKDLFIQCILETHKINYKNQLSYELSKMGLKVKSISRIA